MSVYSPVRDSSFSFTPFTPSSPHTRKYQYSPVDKLVEDLNEAFNTHSDGEEIRKLLQSYVSKNNDWNEYAHYCPLKYSRNLVARTPLYELMVICWSEGQVSPIHNHEGQRCWMAVAEGNLEETQFIFKDTKTIYGSGELEKTETTALLQGTVGYITDEIGLHIIRPTTKNAISIHLYSYPIAECNIYCPSTGTVTRRKMGFFTEFKRGATTATTSAVIKSVPPQLL
eukprot:TRINITY_DN823_c0_g1_i1.p1 TRINITY_DN823_c0_g1~~TRINITY_DN823_c0_g1_i1.p1  ORF type:complete len:227 (+),score=47.40 TRINITY_DN823_c0_g1_i1:243-923(+)